MRNLNLRVQGGYNLKPIFGIDGEIVTYKRNRNESAVINYATEKDVVQVRVTNALELNGPCWWLVQMCFYIFSLFGILNPKPDKNLFVISYSAKLHLADGENNVTMKINQTKDKARAIEILGETMVEEESNAFNLDLQAKKRKKILKFSHVCAWLMLIITLIALLCIKY